jgi:predicted HicB family RNase H-like nuclease
MTSEPTKSNTRALTVRLPEELHKAFKIKCVVDGVDMNAVIIRMIESYVQDKAKQTKKQPKVKQ